LDFDVLKAFYRTNQNDWIEIDQNGKIYLQNLDFGETDIEFKVLDKRSGNITWQKTYIVLNPAPWYLQFWAISLYVMLFSSILILSTSYFVTQSKKKEIEKLTFKNRFNELQMEALQSQMNPHFVFNALNSVQKYILDIDQEKALSFLNQFSILIRRVLDYSDTKLISIEEELEFIQLYLNIENQRFQGTLSIQQEVDCDELIMIPPLLIQPLIENAIIYGLRSKLGEMLISFSIKQEEKSLRIEIKNEINSEVIKNHTFESKSTEIIQKRLALYDAKANLTTTTKDSFFTATILLPITDK
jgi:LytS/YehU family sensor histidine kinase